MQPKRCEVSSILPADKSETNARAILQFDSHLKPFIEAHHLCQRAVVCRTKKANHWCTASGTVVYYIEITRLANWCYITARCRCQSRHGTDEENERDLNESFWALTKRAIHTTYTALELKRNITYDQRAPRFKRRLSNDCIDANAAPLIECTNTNEVPIVCVLPMISSGWNVKQLPPYRHALPPCSCIHARPLTLACQWSSDLFPIEWLCFERVNQYCTAIGTPTYLHDPWETPSPSPLWHWLMNIKNLNFHYQVQQQTPSGREVRGHRMVPSGVTVDEQCGWEENPFTVQRRLLGCESG